MKGVKIVVMTLAACAAAAPCARPGEIHEAVTAGDAVRVTQLLRQSPSCINERVAGGCAELPLHLAAIGGNIEIARMLIDAGAEVDAFDSDESTPLDDAALNRKPEMVRLLLEHGADVNRRDRNGAYPLSFAAASGDSAIVRILLNAGADLNFMSRDGTTLLHFACSRGLWSFADLLLAHGADINAGNREGEAPLARAAGSADSTRIIEAVARGANVNAADSSGWTALTAAIAHRRPANVRTLIRLGADVNKPDRFGRSPLQLTSWGATPDIVTALLDAGADPDHADEHGVTPLSAAAKMGVPEAVCALLAGGCGLGAPDRQHAWTPLHLETIRGHATSVKALLEHGANIDARDDRGFTALDLARRYGHKRLAKHLESQGAQGAAPRETGGCGLGFSRGLAPGEAVVWNLGHSGRAVKTRNHLLIFDFSPETAPPDEPSLCNGAIDPAEILKEDVTVFVSHEHGDHFSPSIFEWRERNPRIRYVFGFRPRDASPVETIAPHETRTIDGMVVTAIRSNDSGVGFVVEVDGLVLYHAGDHANRARDLSGDFTPEVEFIKSRGLKPDIAMLPISGCNFGDQVAVRIGTEYTLDELAPAVFIPMHDGSFGARYAPFIAECSARHPGVRMEALECRGDHVRFRKTPAS